MSAAVRPLPGLDVSWRLSEGLGVIVVVAYDPATNTSVRVEMRPTHARLFADEMGRLADLGDVEPTP